MARVGVEIQHARVGRLDGPAALLQESGVTALGYVGYGDERHWIPIVYRQPCLSSSCVTVGAMTEYGYSVAVAEGYDEAVIRTRLALKGEGFSILTEMHVGGLLGQEAGTDRQYLFMGAWSPPAAVERLDSTLQVGMHLPCNVVVQEQEGGSLIAALDPAEDHETGGAITSETAEQAREALGRVLQKIGAPPA